MEASVRSVAEAIAAHLARTRTQTDEVGAVRGGLDLGHAAHVALPRR